MNEIYLGVLSGTSMDAIDVAAFDLSNSRPLLVDSLSVELPTDYKEKYWKIIRSGECKIEDLGKLDSYTGSLFAEAVLRFLENSKLDKNNIRAIGYHGQTLWHAPFANPPFTMQIGDPNIVAVKTGITTISDFRRADVAAGGQGAPLAPLFHKAIFADPKQSRCVVNIGGISNISVLTNNDFLGFDLGPGNCLMDAWTKAHFAMEFDQDGEIAKTGTVCTELLNSCLNDPYFKLPPPKSTGIESFNLAWLNTRQQTANCLNLKPSDVLATLLELTSTIIADAIKNLKLNTVDVYLCGGGAKNSALRSRLSVLLNKQVYTTAELGVDPQLVECGIFAWLAQQTMHAHALDLTSITGSCKPIVLGSIYGFSGC